MNALQESKLSLYKAVKDFLTKYPAILALIPYSAQFMTALNDLITKIMLNQNLQGMSRTGITMDKQQLRNLLHPQAMNVMMKIVAYAKLTGNNTLTEEIIFPESEMKKCADTVFKSRCQNIYDRANQNSAVLTQFGVTPTILTNLLTAINNYDAIIAAPRTSIAERKEITKMLRTLFLQGDALIDRAQSMVEVVHDTQPEFYDKFMNVSKLVVTGIRHSSLNAKAIDLQTGEPLSGAIFVFTHKTDNTVPKITKKTAAKGSFTIKTMPAGAYDTSITLEGYKPQQKTIYITDSKLTRLAVHMELE